MVTLEDLDFMAPPVLFWGWLRFSVAGIMLVMNDSFVSYIIIHLTCLRLSGYLRSNASGEFLK